MPRQWAFEVSFLHAYSQSHYYNLQYSIPYGANLVLPITRYNAFLETNVSTGSSTCFALCCFPFSAETCRDMLELLIITPAQYAL